MVAGNGAVLRGPSTGGDGGALRRENALQRAARARDGGLTAIGNDYGYDEVFARQVRAHGRPGDVYLALSTSGRSANLLRASEAAGDAGLITWAMTGPAPNPLAAAVDEVLAIECPGTPSVQDVQQVAVHLLCLAFEMAEPAA